MQGRGHYLETLICFYQRYEVVIAAISQQYVSLSNTLKTTCFIEILEFIIQTLLKYL